MQNLNNNTKILHIEASSHCNAGCPMCVRNPYNQNLNPNISLQDLTLEWFKTNINKEEFNLLEKIYFCGNSGDPAASKELLDIIKFIKEQNPGIVVGLNTNGSLKTKAWWKELGLLLSGHLDYVVFSIDGLEDTNHIYRKNTSWKKIIENATSYISAGGVAHWDMLVFDHNKHQVEQALATATELGFSWFRVKETDRWNEFDLEKLDIKPASNILPKESSNNINCERDREQSLYVDSQGKEWPCCYLASYYINPLVDTEIKKYNREELFDLYKERLNNCPLDVCKRSCSITSNKRDQWKKEIQIK